MRSDIRCLIRVAIVDIVSGISAANKSAPEYAIRRSRDSDGTSCTIKFYNKVRNGTRAITMALVQ